MNELYEISHTKTQISLGNVWHACAQCPPTNYPRAGGHRGQEATEVKRPQRSRGHRGWRQTHPVSSCCRLNM